MNAEHVLSLTRCVAHQFGNDGCFTPLRVILFHSAKCFRFGSKKGHQCRLTSCTLKQNHRTTCNAEDGNWTPFTTSYDATHSQGEPFKLVVPGVLRNVGTYLTIYCVASYKTVKLSWVIVIFTGMRTLYLELLFRAENRLCMGSKILIHCGIEKYGPVQVYIWGSKNCPCLI
jgi:hypothetical protein